MSVRIASIKVIVPVVTRKEQVTKKEKYVSLFILYNIVNEYFIYTKSYFLNQSDIEVVLKTNTAKTTMVKQKLQRRMNKEIIFLKNYYSDEKVLVVKTSNENDVVNIFIKNNSKLPYDVKIEVYCDYPFASPNIFLLDAKSGNVIIYYDFFKMCSEFYFSRVDFEEHLCPCCHNIMCCREISNSLLELTRDIEKFHIQFRRLRTLYYIKKFKTKIKTLKEDNIEDIIKYI